MTTTAVETHDGFEVCYPDLFGDKYHAREDRARHPLAFTACVICGRDTSNKGQSMGVYVSGGGGMVIRPEDYSTFPHNGGDMGWFPVGTECIKSIPAQFRTENPYDDKAKGV